MIEDEEVLTLLREIGSMMGFAGNEIAWVYLGCMLASLLCVYYGLIQWIRGWERPKKGKRATQGKRSRRRR